MQRPGDVERRKKGSLAAIAQRIVAAALAGWLLSVPLAGDSLATEASEAGAAATTARQENRAPVVTIDPVRVYFEQRSELEIKRIYRSCARESLARSLGTCEVEVCSTAYDVLLNKHFNGDFAALLRWSRQDQEPSVDSCQQD